LRDWRKLAGSTARGGVGLACYFTEEEFLRILKSFLATLLDPLVGTLGPDEVFLEKTPAHALFIPEIMELLPESRIIHVLRDPRDVVASLLAASQSWGSWWAPKDARAAAKLWSRFVAAVHNAAGQVPRGKYLEIKYEDLHAEPVANLKACAEFLGLDWGEREIIRAVEMNTPEAARATGGGTPIKLGGEAAKRGGKDVVVEPEGFIRRGTAGNWRTELGLRDRYRIWKAIRRPMARAGYAWPFFLLSGSTPDTRRKAPLTGYDAQPKSV
jgi:hypothetical protein